MRYIAVFHVWFVGDSSWSFRELNVNSEEEAHKEASALAFKCNTTCNHCDYMILPIGDKEAVTRKLTLKERFLGKMEV